MLQVSAIRIGEKLCKGMNNITRNAVRTAASERPVILRTARKVMGMVHADSATWANLAATNGDEKKEIKIARKTGYPGSRLPSPNAVAHPSPDAIAFALATY